MERRTLLIINEHEEGKSFRITEKLLPGLKKEYRLDERLPELLKKAGGGEVLSLHHSRLNEAVLTDFNPTHIVAAGRYKDWVYGRIPEEYAFELSLMRSTGLPFLGICAGMQLLAFAFGSPLGFMRDEAGNVLSEVGFTRVKKLREHPLLEGLPPEFTAMMLHRDEPKRLPEGFECIASTEHCFQAAIVHRERPLYGVHFHPEVITEEQPEAYRVLENFYRL